MSVRRACCRLRLSVDQDLKCGLCPQPTQGLNRLHLCREALLLILVLTISGCSRTAGPVAEARSAAALTSETKRGPVTLALRFTPKSPALSDQVKLEVTVTRSSKFEVQPPSLDGLFEDFLIADFDEQLPAIDGEDTVVKHVYTLEPLSAGELDLEAIPYEFTSPDRESPLVVETKPLNVNVTTMVELESAQLRDLSAPAEPVDLPPGPFRYVVWIAAGGGLLAVFVAIQLLRKLNVQPPPELSPSEIAQRDLAALRESGVAEREPKDFYVQLTGIVRRYVENTAGVRAPEQTTDEFLREIADRRLFPDHEQERFKGFLEAADLVKYAAQTPTSRDIASSFESAERFIARPATLGSFPTVES